MRDLIEVAAEVFVATSRRDTTTSTIVVRGREALLVDPSWDPDELAGLADWLDDRDVTVVAGVATHAHHDHLLWHPRFGAAPRWGSVGTATTAATRRVELVRALGDGWPHFLLSLVGRVTASAGPSLHPFTGSDESVELIVHDAHCPGHTAVWLPRRRVLLAGDMLSDVELPLPFDPDDLPAYDAGLNILATVAAAAAVVVPGHGHPGPDALARLRADRDYLAALAAGEDADDPRRTNPGMAAVHGRLRQLTARP